MSDKIIRNIKKLIESEVTAYRIAKETGIAEPTIYDLKNGKSKVENLSLKNAVKLNDYYKSLKK